MKTAAETLLLVYYSMEKQSKGMTKSFWGMVCLGVNDQSECRHRHEHERVQKMPCLYRVERKQIMMELYFKQRIVSFES